MLSLLLLSLLSSLSPATAAASLPPIAAAQDEEGEKPDKRPEVKELIDQLAKESGARGEKDPEAIQTVDKLLKEFAASGSKDRASIVAALAKCFDLKRKELEEGLADTRLHSAVAMALGEMGPESVKVLTKWIGNKALGDPGVQRLLILSLGKTRDPGGLRPLLGCLDNHDTRIVAAGAEALGNFDKAKLELRKQVFEELLKVLTSARGQVDQDVNDTIARERYDVIAAPIITSLTRLSGQEIRDPVEWQRWWNKNKKEDWDKQAVQ